jgi:RNA polymerase sigma-70 factor (ECF subfamily)
MTRSEHDAEDLLQEVFIKAISWLDELEEIEFPRAWLMKVMYNAFVDQARKNQRSPMSIAMAADESGDPEQLPSQGDAPPNAADREIRIEQITRAMRHMDSDQCALIAMRDVEGLSIEELCRITGMPAGTIKAQLHRARRKLGRLLSNEAVIRPRLRVVGGQK